MFSFLKHNSHSKFNYLIKQIKEFTDTFNNYSNDKLKKQTIKLKKELLEGKTSDDILPEAFGTAIEVIRRILGLSLFNVQIVGGIILHQGKIAEMKTG
ncbi:preprotein translocase subunit SecA, partial [Bacillus paranthracis]